jgi:hypothetical protein
MKDGGGDREGGIDACGRKRGATARDGRSGSGVCSAWLEQDEGERDRK